MSYLLRPLHLRLWEFIWQGFAGLLILLLVCPVIVLRGLGGRIVRRFKCT